jgi:hypothetical protein
VPTGPGAGRALDFEKERALRALGAAPRGPAGRLPGRGSTRAAKEIPACHAADGDRYRLASSRPGKPEG